MKKVSAIAKKLPPYVVGFLFIFTGQYMYMGSEMLAESADGAAKALSYVNYRVSASIPAFGFFIIMVAGIFEIVTQFKQYKSTKSVSKSE